MSNSNNNTSKGKESFHPANFLPSQLHQSSVSINDQQSVTSSQNNTTNKKNNKKKSISIQQTPNLNFQQNASNSTSIKNPKYIYSVDDDLDEIEQDMEREYLEGFTDALRYRYKKSSKNLKEVIPKSQFLAQHQTNPELQSISQDAWNSLINASNNLKRLEQKEADYHKHLPHSDSPHIQEDEIENENEEDFQEPAEYYEDESEQERDQEQERNQDDNDNTSISSEESYTLRERQDAINTTHPFGIRIWKPAIYKKIRSVQKEADSDIHDTGLTPKRKITWEVHLTNFLWSITFGLSLFIICIFGSIVLILAGSINYSKVFYNLGIYLLWPFGKLVYLQKDENYLSEDRNDGTTIREYERWRDEEHNKLFFSAKRPNGPSVLSDRHPSESQPVQQDITPLRSFERNNITHTISEEDDDDYHIKRRFFGRGDWNLGRIIFYLFFYLILNPIMSVIWLFSWLLVFTIPMAKVLNTLSVHIKKHPLALFFRFDDGSTYNNSNVLICTYRSSGYRYYKYTVEGTNIFFINLMFVVIFTILDFYLLREYLGLRVLITDESVIFGLCLLSIIPLAYFIGQAVASISAQSSMGLGAVINAFFSTIVEIFLYCVALSQQNGSLVEGSMIGSILGAVLLLPGLSMCAGALKRKTQRYNPASAGVSSTMLLFSLSVMFAPTLFHQIYGTYEIKCNPCIEEKTILRYSNCQSCHFFQPPIQINNLFNTVLKPFSIVCAILLFAAYAIGLWFTLRTHAALIWQTPITDKKQPLDTSQTSEGAQQQQHQSHEGGGHDAPNWSKNKSTFVLLTATILYAIIAEVLVDCVDSVLASFPIDPKFLGITIFALVPNTTEFLNAISFATHGNVALSMEIGSAYALQVVLIQIPSLVLYSLFFIDVSNINDVKESMFTLIFPKWDLIASVISVVLFTYIYAEGKSNYFKGAILILGYVVCVMGFWFVGMVESGGYFTSSFQFMVNS
ncbi:hypothetical protein WICMUC_003302 [Wickerhamomyces mucosus]|uniref:Uncharacterized protein n=1 Tax=Wickerhamomyces mucosus TaxID=1378264 RepID=A0A9P8TDF8_9ASCO|nr:hypothetical protein WICMUC_003302 [Wickerhamomyces mucosus]